MKEYNAFAAEESEEFEVSNPQDDGNVLEWEVVVFGPADSPYADGMFFVKMVFPDTYPEHPPKEVRMKTKIFHPNIDKEGRLCLGDIKDNWNNKMNVKTIIDHILNLVKNPDPQDAINSEVAKIMADKPDDYKKIAAEWTENYAQ